VDKLRKFRLHNDDATLLDPDNLTIDASLLLMSSLTSMPENV